MKKCFCIIILVCLLFFVLMGGYVAASSGKEVDFPKKTINIIVPYSPGGSSEPPARIMAQIMKDELFNVDVIVTCMPGAGTLLGQEEVINAKPDGYTLLFHHTAMVTGHLLGRQEFSFKKYTPVAMLMSNVQNLNVRADAPWKDFGELLEDLRQRPEEISFTWPGMGGVSHFLCEWFFTEAGIKGVKKLIAEGGAQADQWLLGGHVDVAGQGGIRSLALSGDFRVLALATEERWDMLPDVPTFKEHGFDNIILAVDYGLWAPPNTSTEVVEVLSEAVKYVVGHPKFLEFCKKNMIMPNYKDTKGLAENFSRITENLTPIAKIIKGE